MVFIANSLVVDRALTLRAAFRCSGYRQQATEIIRNRKYKTHMSDIGNSDITAAEAMDFAEP
jgi:hypothetical protein